MKSSCEIVRDLLPLYQDNIASDASVQMIEEHLVQCSECTSFLKDIRKEMPTLSKVQVENSETTEYVSLAKRMRRAKWCWRPVFAALIFCVVWTSSMYAGGYRLSSKQAAYASNIVDERHMPLTALEIGNDRVMYIFDDDGLYREVNVTYRLPFWKYQQIHPDHYIRQDAPMQLLTHKSIASSLDNSFYIVYVVAVNDDRVAYIELGKEGKMQSKEVDKGMVTFYWNETGNWDGSVDWSGGITLSELRGTAYAADGTLLYELGYVDNERVWLEVK